APIDNHELIWSEIFPNAKHIYLTRRNKVRQAVSWWKAIQDETWHLRAGEKRAKGDDFYEGKYVFDALMHLFKELMLKECATQAYFSKHNIVPFTVVYEDFVADYEATIHRIINFLGIPHNGYTVATPKLQRTANAHSELWVDRFRKDLNIKGSWEIL
ncbi:MAG: Stf0 family sulfotransferase, partial [Bacteroidota bacterium]